MTEVELKFRIDPTRLRTLRARLRALDGIEAAPRRQTLRSVYYDTEAGTLRAAGIALRLRREGRRWLQTVKRRASNHGGLQSAEEVETPAAAGKLALTALPPRVRTEIEELIAGHRLQPVFETAMQRTHATVALNGHARAEIAIDEGEIIAGERRAPFCELELELIEGPLGALYGLTRTLLPAGGLDFSRRSKAARGWALSETGHAVAPIAPRNATAVGLAPGQSSETAARDVLRDAFGQIAANVETVRKSDDPEGPHQLRVGLRRLRSAFAAFAPAIGSGATPSLNAEARWLGAEVGRLRDLDVAKADLVDPEARAHPEIPGFARLSELLEAEAAATRAELRETLEADRTQSFLLALGEFIETRGWLDRDDHDQTARLARPVEALAIEALDKRWRAVRKRARRIADLNIEARHDLRKELKKLRYALEFFTPVLPTKRAVVFVKRLKRLQQVFGDLNDLAMAEELFASPEAPGAADPAVQRAVGYLLGARSVQAEAAWTHARGLYRELEATPLPWH